MHLPLLVLLHVVAASDCDTLWSCDGLPVPQTRRFPGACGPRPGGLRLGMGNAWPRRCVREFLGLLFDTCGGPAPSDECVNLAPAGSGTVTLAESMRVTGYEKCTNTNRACWHHHHANIGIREALTRAPCVLVTSREPAARLESGHHYWRTLLPINQMLETFALRYENHTVLKPPFGFFGTPTASYFAGLTPELCHEKRIHILCTEHLGEELGRLGLASNRRANVRVAARGSQMAEDWRHWLNLEVYGLDSIIHARACGAYGGGYSPKLEFPRLANATTKGALAYLHLSEEGGRPASDSKFQVPRFELAHPLGYGAGTRLNRGL